MAFFFVIVCSFPVLHLVLGRLYFLIVAFPGCLLLYFYTLPQDSGRVLWFHVGRVCVRPSVHILFPDDNLSKHQWIFTNLVCALILWRSGLGLLMGKFHQCLTELSAHDTIMVWYYSFFFNVFLYIKTKL